jgi:hypothetical protein
VEPQKFYQPNAPDKDNQEEFEDFAEDDDNHPPTITKP